MLQVDGALAPGAQARGKLRVAPVLTHVRESKVVRKMEIPKSDLEAAFVAAYRQKFSELLKQSCSSASSSQSRPPSPCGSAGGGATVVPVGVVDLVGAPPLAAPATRWPNFARVSVCLLLSLTIIYAVYRIFVWKSPVTTGGVLGGSLIAPLDQGFAQEKGEASVAAQSVSSMGSGGVPKTGAYFVMFHSESCKHCLQAKPEFAKVAAKKSQKARFKLCDHNCLQSFPGSGKKLNVTGLPTFIGFSDGVEVGRLVGAPRGGEAELNALCEKMFP